MTETDDDLFAPRGPIPFPEGAKKLRQRIRSYERIMRKEKEETGDISDGYGKRFLLGPMYMLMGDLEGALKHFEWYEAEFGFEGECFQFMCWTLALLRSGDTEKAEYLFRQTMLANLYQIPALIGVEFERLPIWHGSNTEEPSWLECVPAELYELWNEEELKWARDMWTSWEMEDIRDAYIDLRKLLTDAPPSSKERGDVIRLMQQIECRPYDDLNLHDIRSATRSLKNQIAAS